MHILYLQNKEGENIDSVSLHKVRSILKLFTGISNGLQTEEIVPPIANCGTGIRRLNGVYKNGERKSE